MKKHATLYEKGDHKWTILFYDDHKEDHLISTNEYLIQHADRYLITDPGGTEVFPEIISALGELVDLEQLEQVFCSHQDPDIFSAVALWLGMKPHLKVYIPHIWLGFLLHFGGTKENFECIQDEGTTISLGGLALQAIPAHYLHSSGNLHLYDPNAKVLFTGDTGAALTSDPEDFVVRDFDKHIPLIEGFHRRWYGSNEHKNQWCERVMKMDVDFLCPQHGLVYEGENVRRFLEWFYDLKVGHING